jgi:hypothetical protein
MAKLMPVKVSVAVSCNKYDNIWRELEAAIGMEFMGFEITETFGNTAVFRLFFRPQQEDKHG